MSKTWQEPKNSKTGQCPRVAAKDGKHSAKAQDLFHIAVLVILTLGVGIYIISTTVLISKDGVYYIERAQNLSNDPVGVIKAHPPGYPFLILITHKFVTLFTDSSSQQTWIYSAQSITLLCRLFALILLYFIGKILVGARKSFWAVFILVILPHSAKFGCEAVREWPYILFLSLGYLALLIGANQSKWWFWGLAGLSAGLGYLIRPESAQLVVYGLAWLILSMFRPKLWCASRWKILVALALLLVAFAAPAMPYMKYTGQIIPPKIRYIINALSLNTLSDKADVPNANVARSNHYTAEFIAHKVFKILAEIFQTVGENLMWFFMAALAIGAYYHFRGSTKREETFLITAFILVNVTMIILRYHHFRPTVSKRYSLPLITFTIFYIPVGLRAAGNWLESKFPINNRRGTGNSKTKRGSWFLLLLLVGVGICIPKLFRPLRIEKQGYRDTAKWLRENTAATDVVAVPDTRIAFYAERKDLKHSKKPPEQADYIVRIIRNEDEKSGLETTMQEKHSVWVDRREKKRRIVTYKVL